MSFVAGWPEDGDAAGPDEPSGAVEDLEAQGSRGFKQEKASLFFTSGPACSGIDLESDEKVVGDGNELLPCVVGSITAGWD